MKVLLSNLIFLVIFQMNANAQESILGKWTVTKVEIANILVAENNAAKVDEEFLASIQDAKERAFTQGMLEGLGKSMLNSEMIFLNDDIYKEINGKSKKEFSGTYKFNSKKGDLKIIKKEGTDKMSVVFTDSSHLVLTNKNSNTGEMVIYLTKSN